MKATTFLDGRRDQATRWHGWLWAGCVLVVCLIIAASVTPAAQPVQAQSSGGRDLSWWVNSSGGGRSTSAHFVLESAVGQPSVGDSASGSYKLGSGFMLFQDWWSMFLPLVKR
jgi:hypothetical protein